MIEQILWACLFIPLAIGIITIVQKQYEIIFINIAGNIQKKSDFYN